MPKLSNPLDHVRIAAPCSADWDQMFSFEGERVRFCSQCNLNVYNLSEMSRQEAEDLITKTEGRLCVRFYQKADGSVLTQDCPVGLKAIKRRMALAAQIVLGLVLSFVSGLGLYISHLGRKSSPLLPIRPTPEKPILVIGSMPMPAINHSQTRIGKLRIEPRQGEVETRGETKRRD
jgi:hypothetical protein